MGFLLGFLLELLGAGFFLIKVCIKSRKKLFFGWATRVKAGLDIDTESVAGACGIGAYESGLKLRDIKPGDIQYFITDLS